MTGTRAATALALLLSVVAITVAFAAAMRAFRDDGAASGRLVDTRLDAAYGGYPLLFPLDDFFLSKDAEGRVHALYVYPPGHFGEVRGCRVVWDPAASGETAAGVAGPGLFVDPCGGARFTPDGAFVSGPADRGLDYFAVTPSPRGFLVDTRTLLCGRPPDVEDKPAGATPTPTPDGNACERAGGGR